MGAFVLTLDVVVVMTVSYGAPGFIVMHRLFFSCPRPILDFIGL